VAVKRGLFRSKAEKAEAEKGIKRWTSILTELPQRVKKKL